MNKNYVLKYNLHLYFLMQQKLLISSEKMHMSAELSRAVSRDSYIFWSFFGISSISKNVIIV